jgi:hypothetical protein
MRYALVCDHNPLRLDGCGPAHLDQAPPGRPITLELPDYVLVMAPPRSGMGTLPYLLNWADASMAANSKNDSGRDDDANSSH